MKIVKKGFTLIELLIVIVVIGVLSAMMMLASTEVEASADVTRVINDMEAVKMAVIMCVTDNPDEYPNPPFCDKPSIDEVKKYLANEDIINSGAVVDGKWEIVKQTSGGTKWFVYYKIPQYLTDNPTFKYKLGARARKELLFSTPEGDPIDVALQKGTGLYNGGSTAGGGKTAGDTVYMLIMYEPKS